MYSVYLALLRLPGSTLFPYTTLFRSVTAVACGLFSNFYVVVSLYLVYGIAVGIAMPVKQAYLNAHIPSAQRATILSLDSIDRKSTRLNSSHANISYAVFCF